MRLRIEIRWAREILCVHAAADAARAKASAADPEAGGCCCHDGSGASSDVGVGSRLHAWGAICERWQAYMSPAQVGCSYVEPLPGLKLELPTVPAGLHPR